MSRFFNHLLNESCYEPGSEAPLPIRLEVGTPKIIVDNVEEYIYPMPEEARRGTAGLYEINISDYPQLVPPFELMWMEYRERLMSGMEFAGVIVSRKSFKTDAVDVPSNAGHRIGISAFRRQRNKNWMEGNTLNIWVDEAGDIVNMSQLLWNETMRQVHKKEYGEVARIDPTWLLAISLMNCRNVTIKEPDESQRLAKKRIKKNKPPYRYHVLDIKPMTRVLETEGRIGEVGLKQALHICRGHFKDYTEKGLFGKYHGVYWWESQVRGNAEEGIVDKDYNVLAKEK